MSKKKKFYAVVHGYQPGIYARWDGKNGAQAQVMGYSSARYRGFASYAEAAAWFTKLSGGEGPQYFGPPIQATAFDLEDPTAPPIDYQAELNAGKVVIFTDGSSIGNPGPGGYAAVLLDGGRRKELSGGFSRTTNNRMELLACVEALKTLEDSTQTVLYSDSKYVVRGITEGWAKRWRSNNWKTKDGGVRENADLWGLLLEQTEKHDVEFNWLAGHAGHRENERCDRLAQAAARQKNLPPDSGYHPA